MKKQQRRLSDGLLLLIFNKYRGKLSSLFVWEYLYGWYVMASDTGQVQRHVQTCKDVG